MPSDSIGAILLVEDDELFAQNLKLKLRRYHIDCDWHPSFEFALQALKDKIYHALVADIFLQSDRANGLGLISQAKACGVPSVIITSHLSTEIAKQGLNEGADALLEKPFDVKDLVKCLNDIWENPRGMIGRREHFFDMQKLTEKEKEIARLVVKGLSNQEVANVSGTSVATVKFYTNQIFEKCDVHSRAELCNTIFPT